MTPAEFKAARESLGLTAAALAKILNTDISTVQKWEAPEGSSTARKPSPIAVRVMGWLLAGFRPPEWPQG